MSLESFLKNLKINFLLTAKLVMLKHKKSIQHCKRVSGDKGLSLPLGSPSDRLCMKTSLMFSYLDVLYKRESSVHTVCFTCVGESMCPSLLSCWLLCLTISLCWTINCFWALPLRNDEEPRTTYLYTQVDVSPRQV